MIEVLLGLRIIADYFWEFKSASIISAALFFVFCSLFSIVQGKKFKFVSTDLYIAAFIVVIIFSEAFNASQDSIVILFKFCSYFALYFSGRVGPTRFAYPEYLGFFCLLSLLGLFISAIIGVGYQIWGGVVTFSGGYYFKTDVAISALIFLAIACTMLTKRVYQGIAVVCAAYVVFKANSRIALPLVVAMPVFVFFIRNGGFSRVNVKLVAKASCLVAGSMFLVFMIDFKGLGLLGFDFSNPFSASNTQGRSVIWEALVEGFVHADLIQKLIGSGLNADVTFTTIYSDNAMISEGVSAHNSYLYLLVCTGLVGSAVFYGLIFSVLRRLPLLLSAVDSNSTSVALLVVLLFVIFALTSVTVDSIIRPQLMTLFLFFSGMAVQRGLVLKTRDKSNRVKNSARA